LSGDYHLIPSASQRKFTAQICIFRQELTSVAFGPDGTLLVSGSADKTLRLWRVSDGSFVREFKGHTDSVNSVAFSPDGTLLASGSLDMTVRLLDAEGSRGMLDICFFDPAANPPEVKANTYKITDAAGITYTYTLPCGSPIPAGAVCTCNCIPGAYNPPPSCSCVSVPSCRCVSAEILPCGASLPRGAICTCHCI